MRREPHAIAAHLAVDVKPRARVDAERVLLGAARGRRAAFRAAPAGEVPIGMVAQVDGRRRVARRAPRHAQLVGADRVCHLRTHGAREPLVAVGALEREREHSRAVGVVDARVRAVPDARAPAARAAVQRRVEVVRAKRVRGAVELEARARDPVRDAADGATHERKAVHRDLRERRVAHCELVDGAGAVGRASADERRPIADDRDTQVAAAAERPLGHGLSLELAEALDFDTRPATDVVARATARRGHAPGRSRKEERVDVAAQKQREPDAHDGVK